MNTFNKGEWSELYAVLKVITEGKFNVADENSEVYENLSYEIIRVIINELYQNGEKSFYYDKENIKIEYNKNISYIKTSEFQKICDIILNEIKTKEKDGKATFEIKEINDFIQNLEIKVKAKAKAKSDLKAQIKDYVTATEPILTYSIKSKLGNPATLFNASGKTDFIYELSTFDENKLNSINSEHSLPERLKLIKKEGIVKFNSVKSNTLKNNLIFIDGDLIEIIGNLLLYSYEYEVKHICDIVEKLNKNNPLNYDSTLIKNNIYQNKLEKFIRAASFGMFPGKIWDGKEEITGGILIVKKTGDIVLLDNIYHKEQLNSYLIKNTKLDTPSSNRYHIMKVYKENNKYYFTLNLQIRFL